MDDLHIESASGPGVAEAEIEIVERKGLGHPDTICDSVMERIAQTLHRAYLDRFGRVLHYNCDKGLLVAGAVERRLGGGRVVEPMRLVVGDRAAAALGGQRLDVGEIAVEAAKAWFRENLARVDPERHVQYQVELRPGSEELTDLFQQEAPVLGANDTSAAVGYAPLSETERLVLETERYLNSAPFKTLFPETGEDVKVMAVRCGRGLALTVAMPFLDRLIESEAAYFKLKRDAVEALLSHLQAQRQTIDEIEVDLNSLDRPGRGIAGMYLSVLGTSAEDADSGEVGRGNQTNGVIALHRPRGAEAAAGKNAVSHVGKIYNVLAHRLAAHLHAQIRPLREVTVWLCSRIGDPVNRPRTVAMQVRLDPRVAVQEVAAPIGRLLEAELARMPDFCRELGEGRYPVC